MPVTTTVLNEDSAAIISDDSPARFNWGAAIAGALIATGVTFLLLTLGSGVGLSLVTVRHATASGTTTFLTLGAVYFLAAQAFGFAVGGHVVGRLIGPALETSREEEFRAGAHGLAAWALTVVATATIVALSALTAANSAATGSLAAAATNNRDAQPAATAYWTDKLFRAPVGATQASLGWPQYAQADTGTATDATTPPPAEPGTVAPGDTDTTTTAEPPRPADAAPVYLQNTAPAPTTQFAATTLPPLARSLGADKAEAGRILTVGLANGLSADDRGQLTRLVAQDTGLTLNAAQSRVNDVEARMRDDATKAADAARKAAATVSLWTAFALLFGAIVAVAAAISARWQDDREAGLLPGTRVVETRF